MSERYFVATVSGFSSVKLPNTKTHPGLTALVLDRHINCRTMAQYRSEDERGGYRTAAIMVERALQKAHEHARRLNEQEAHDGVLG